MRKVIVTAAGALLAVPFSAIIAASPANAVPCVTPQPPQMSAECKSCVQANGGDGNAIAICEGQQPARRSLPSTGYPDCDQYQLPTSRATCVDQHLAGER